MREWMTIIESLDAIPEDLRAQILADPRLKRGIKIAPSATLWRGEGEDTGHGMASYGLGYYFTCDRRGASKYGDVFEVAKSMLPDNAFRFNTTNDFQIWKGNAIRALGYRSNLDFVAVYHDFGEFCRVLDPTCEGIQMFTGKDSIFVNWAVDEGRSD